MRFKGVCGLGSALLFCCGSFRVSGVFGFALLGGSARGLWLRVFWGVGLLGYEYT